MNLYDVPKGICSVLVGSSCAAFFDNFDVLTCTLTIIFIILLQIAISLQTNYCELRYHKMRKVDIELTGKIMVLTSEDHIPLRVASIAFLLLATTVGLGLAVIGGWPACLTGAIVTAALYYYNLTNYPLRYSKWTPLMVFFFFGPVAVLGTYFLSSYRDITTPYTAHEIIVPVILSSIMGLYAANIWLIREKMRFAIQDSNEDTFIYRITPGQVRKLILLNTIVLFILQTLLGFVASRQAFITLLPIPILCLTGNLALYIASAKLKQQNTAYRTITILSIYNMVLYTVLVLLYQIYKF